MKTVVTRQGTEERIKKCSRRDAYLSINGICVVGYADEKV